MIEPWKTIGSTPAGDFRIFRIRSERKLSPRTGREHGFYVIDSVNWVNVVAVTPDEHLVLIRQYRHGSDTIELEVPGGMMDAEDATPEATAGRELREETGYAGDAGVVIGEVYPNPAIMSNTCYTVLIPNCTLRHETAFDHSEDVVTERVPVRDATRLVAEGKIRHSLVVAALFHFELWRRRGSG